jgi:hypothetical protein
MGLIKESRFETAAQQIAKYGVFQSVSNYDIYMRLAREIIHDGTAGGLTALREVLFKLVSIILVCF